MQHYSLKIKSTLATKSALYFLNFIKMFYSGNPGATVSIFITNGTLYAKM
jgi:hypothetical protein